LAKVIRNKKEVYRGKVTSLKRFSEDTKEVLANFECGIVLDNFSTVEPGDIIIPYEMKQKQ
jgi:translation initiation factor IF-2